VRSDGQTIAPFTRYSTCPGDTAIFSFHPEETGGVLEGLGGETRDGNPMASNTDTATETAPMNRDHQSRRNRWVIVVAVGLATAGCDRVQKQGPSSEGGGDDGVCESDILEHAEEEGDWSCGDGGSVAESVFSDFPHVDFQAFFQVRVYNDLHLGGFRHSIVLDVTDWDCRFDEYHCGEYLDTLDGVDDCELKRFVNGGCCGVGGGWDGYSSSGADYIAGDQTGPMPARDDAGIGASFEVELDEAAFGQSYGFETHGPEGSAMSFPSLVTLPEQAELTSPALAPNAQLKNEALALEWTGDGPNPLFIHLRAYDAEYPFSDYSTAYEIHCEVVDDGAFEIPKALIEQIPGGQFVSLELERVDHTLESVEGIDAVDTLAAHASVTTLYSQLTH
jgi:hypothetical protein